MSKSDATEAFDIYKSFIKQTDKVVDYLGVVRKLHNVVNVPVPNLKHAPTSLVKALEEYLNDPNFEDNRREYKRSLGVVEGKPNRTPSPNREYIFSTDSARLCCSVEFPWPMLIRSNSRNSPKGRSAYTRSFDFSHLGPACHDVFCPKRSTRRSAEDPGLFRFHTGRSAADDVRRAISAVGPLTWDKSETDSQVPTTATRPNANGRSRLQPLPTVDDDASTNGLHAASDDRIWRFPAAATSRLHAAANDGGYGVWEHGRKWRFRRSNASWAIRTAADRRIRSAGPEPAAATTNATTTTDRIQPPAAQLCSAAAAPSSDDWLQSFPPEHDAAEHQCDRFQPFWCVLSTDFSVPEPKPLDRVGQRIWRWCRAATRLYPCTQHRHEASRSSIDGKQEPLCPSWRGTESAPHATAKRAFDERNGLEQATASIRYAAAADRRERRVIRPRVAVAMEQWTKHEWQRWRVGHLRHRLVFHIRQQIV